MKRMIIAILASLVFGILSVPGAVASTDVSVRVGTGYYGDEYYGYRHHYRHHSHHVWVRGHWAWRHGFRIWIPGHYIRVYNY